MALVDAAVVVLLGAAVWALARGLRAAFLCAAFCAGLLGLASALERGAAAAALRQADSADRAVAAALAAWSLRGAPPSGRVVSFFVEDGLDGDDELGAGPTWLDALRAIPGALARADSAPRRLGLALPGAVVDWRTQTLAWASDRERQYDALARALAAAKKAGVRVEVVARGRGAQNVLAALRRAREARPDRMLVVGREPGAGDEALAADAEFIYAGPGGPEAACTGPEGALVRTRGRGVGALLADANAALSRDVDFRAGALAGRAPSAVGETLPPWRSWR